MMFCLTGCTVLRVLKLVTRRSKEIKTEILPEFCYRPDTTQSIGGTIIEVRVRIPLEPDTGRIDVQETEHGSITINALLKSA